MRQDKDRSSKWLIGHHGDAIVKMAGYWDIRRWRAVQPELVAPRRLPDGLLEVFFEGDSDPTLFLIEIETYPGNDVDEQVFDDVLLVLLDRGIIPEVITLVLRPKGNVRVEGRFRRRSARGSAELAGSWRVIELWNLRAEDLLAAGDVGLIPWVPLTATDLPSDTLLRECRERIDREAKPEEVPAMLTVTQLLGSLVFSLENLSQIFGGVSTMIDSPLLDELKVVLSRSYVLEALEAHFGTVPKDRLSALDVVRQPSELKRLHRLAITSPDLETFINELNRSVAP